MRIRCTFNFIPQPNAPNEYIRPMVIDVLCEGESDEQIVAKLEIDHLDIWRAVESNADLSDVCDADSQEWEHVFTSIFEPGSNGERLREDFGIIEDANHLLLVRNMIFHPIMRDWQGFILDHVSNLFGCFSATVIWRGDTDLTDSELHKLGFRIIAGDDFLFRLNTYRTEYVAEEDPRRCDEIDIPDDAEEYVESAWTKIGGRASD